LKEELHFEIKMSFERKFPIGFALKKKPLERKFFIELMGFV
jgi:hypothetical protein